MSLSVLGFVFLWLGVLYVIIFGYKSLGSRAIPLVYRLSLILVIIIIQLLHKYLLMNVSTTDTKKSMFIQVALAVFLLSAYIWQDVFYKSYEGSTYLLFHPAFVFSIFLYIISLVLGSVSIIKFWFIKNSGFNKNE